MKIERIKPPKYKVGRYSLNEYEVRKLMVDVANGVHPAGIKIIDEEKTCATILSNGRLDKNICGFDINSRFTIELIKLDRMKREAKKYNL